MISSFCENFVIGMVSFIPVWLKERNRGTEGEGDGGYRDMEGRERGGGDRERKVQTSSSQRQKNSYLLLEILAAWHVRCKRCQRIVSKCAINKTGGDDSSISVQL